MHVNAILWSHLTAKPVAKTAEAYEAVARGEAKKQLSERSEPKPAAIQLGIAAAKREWVRVIEATNRFRSGESCGVTSPGRLMKTDQTSGKQVHMRYSHEKANGAGPACDNGMLVAVDGDYMVRLGVDLGDRPEPGEPATKKAKREKL